MQRTCKTREALVVLDTTYDKLFNKIRTRQIQPPGRDASGHYLWTDAEIAAARKALAIDRRRKKPAPANQAA